MNLLSRFTPNRLCLVVAVWIVLTCNASFWRLLFEVQGHNARTYVFAASLGQGLFSDPIDKTITSFVVFIILTSISTRVIARFPNGERLTADSYA